MNGLIGNLKTHEMNKSQDFSKKEAKKDKSLMLKFTPKEGPSEDDDLSYLPRDFRRL